MLLLLFIPVTSFAFVSNNIISSQGLNFKDNDGVYAMKNSKFTWMKNNRVILQKTLKLSTKVLIANSSNIYLIGDGKIYWINKSNRILSKEYKIKIANNFLSAYLIFNSIFISSLDGRFVSSSIFNTQSEKMMDFFAYKPIATFNGKTVFIPTEVSINPEREVLKILDKDLKETSLEFKFPKSLGCGMLDYDYESGFKYWQGKNNSVYLTRLCGKSRVFFTFDWTSITPTLVNYRTIAK